MSNGPNINRFGAAERPDIKKARGLRGSEEGGSILANSLECIYVCGFSSLPIPLCRHSALQVLQDVDIFDFAVGLFKRFSQQLLRLHPATLFRIAPLHSMAPHFQEKLDWCVANKSLPSPQLPTGNHRNWECSNDP